MCKLNRLNWPQKTGQFATVRPEPVKEYDNDEAQEFSRSVLRLGLIGGAARRQDRAGYVG